MLWLFPVVGLLALIWFLVRVIPKPSRAAYPCQRVAASLASSFLAGLFGLGGAFLAFRKARQRLGERRYFLATACVILGLAATWFVVTDTLDETVTAAFVPSDPANSPMGVAKGIFPGRVVWVHDPDATNWDGPTSGTFWWEPSRANQALVDQMLSKGLRRLTGTDSDAEAWEALFTHYNQTHGRGDVGYQAGEKIVIKVNLNTNSSVQINTNTYIKASQKNDTDVSPHAILALLRHLVNVAGVAQEDISVGDPIRYFAAHDWDFCHAEFPNVVYLDAEGKLGRTRAVKSANPVVFWSKYDPGSYYQADYLPTHYVEAAYMINFAAFKGHERAGVTACGKNHYGSFCRRPDGRDNLGRRYYDLHTTIASWGVQAMGQYRALVDIIGNDHLGGKTLLYLVDGLWGGTRSGAEPLKWWLAPFNDDWPSSIFLSQDPVAVDSVVLDFVRSEYPADTANYADDYLHEAALADNPPSGTFYAPNDANHTSRLNSLGAHEHWNNVTDKQYSRNLGTGSGIELVTGDDAPLMTAPENLRPTAVSDSQIDLAWDLPIGMETSVITSYKVYRDGAFIGWSPSDKRTYSDVGLDEQTTYTYMVSAMAVIHEGPKSDPVAITTVSPLTIVTWSSGAEHGRGAGEGLLEIPDDGSFCEPRSSGVCKLILAFDGAIDPTSLIAQNVEVAGRDANGYLDVYGATTISTTTRNGETEGVIIFTPALRDYAKYAVSVSGVTDVGGNPLSGDADRIMTALEGDVSCDLRVNVTDLSRVRAARTKLIDPNVAGQVRADVSGDGRINATDSSRVRAKRSNDARGIAEPVIPRRPYVEKDGLVIMEAEGYHDNVSQGGHHWQFVTSPSGYSGDGAMKAVPVAGTLYDVIYVPRSPRLDFQVIFETTGTYYVRVRAYTADGGDNSCHVGLDGQAVSTSDRIGEFAAGQWYWEKGTRDGPLATLEINTAGLHTINVWMREDGFIFDRLALTTNSSYVPPE